MENRAGRFIRQPSGYSAFVPKPLPPEPPVTIDEELQALLSIADRNLGRLDGSIQMLPNPDLFVLMYVRREAVLSSQIEGTQASLDDVLAAEARIFEPGPDSDVDEIINYIGAMNHGMERLDEIPFSVRLIKELHQKILHGVRGAHRSPGELRRSQNWIGPSGCTIQEATFVPPPPQEVPGLLGDLELYVHSDHGLPQLVQIGLVHAHFETIHPFLDGNGRLGRLLITFFLCWQEILSQPVLYLSLYFKRHREKYYELLQSIRDEGDWESWLKFFLRGVVETAAEATETSRKIISLREACRTKITTEFGRVAGDGLLVLEELFLKPIMEIKDVQTILGKSYTTANNLIDKLHSAGMVQEMTGYKRNRRFRFGKYINLFLDDG